MSALAAIVLGAEGSRVVWTALAALAAGLVWAGMDWIGGRKP